VNKERIEETGRSPLRENLVVREGRRKGKSDGRERRAAGDKKDLPSSKTRVAFGERSYWGLQDFIDRGASKKPGNQTSTYYG